MNSKQLLINRSVSPDEMHNRLNANGVNWYTPKEYIESFKSVVKCNYHNRTNSSGDWNGWFIQKIGKNYFLIRFSQENMGFGSGGYNLDTGEVLAVWNGEMPTQDEIYNVIIEDDEIYRYQ